MKGVTFDKMQPDIDKEVYWNLFARELSRILALQKITLEQLTDRAGIQPQKVRRLVRSLKTPAHLPVFDPAEMRAVRDAFSLGQDEMNHLQAALLATSIQRMLCDYVNQNAARQSAAQIFPLLVQAVSAQVFGKVSSSARGDESPAEDDVLSLALDAALDEDDRGTDALLRSTSSRLHIEQVRQAKQAHEHYQAALDELRSLSPVIQRLPGWSVIKANVQRHLERAADRLEDLGEEI